MLVGGPTSVVADRDEARRIAVNIAKLPGLSSRHKTHNFRNRLS
jgi:hypothetical protein